MDKFAVIRIYYKGDKETHSVEFKDTYLEAQQRFYNIVASDLANPDVTYQAAYIINASGLMLDGKVFDRRPAPEPEQEA